MTVTDEQFTITDVFGAEQPIVIEPVPGTDILLFGRSVNHWDDVAELASYLDAWLDAHQPHKPIGA